MIENLFEDQLKSSIERDRVQLTSLLNGPVKQAWEDGLYRFYHQSHKVFRLQKLTDEIVRNLQALMPAQNLNPWFKEIIEAGSRQNFTQRTNANWTTETRPVVEAFCHARYFLEMACKQHDESSVDIPVEGEDSVRRLRMVDSGWSALLILFQAV